MKLSEKQKNVYAETYVLLGYLEQNDFDKIPKDIVNAIEQNRNKEYSYEIDDNLEIKNQKMMPETKALIFNILTKYILSADENNIIMKKQMRNEHNIEMKKIEMYNPENIFRKDDKKDNIKQNVNGEYNKNKPLLSEKRHINFFKKIIHKIKAIFKKSNL